MLFRIFNICMTINIFDHLRQERFQSFLRHNDIIRITWEHDSSSVLIDTVNMPLFSLKFNFIADFERQIRTFCLNDRRNFIIRKRYQIIEIKYRQSILIHIFQRIILLITDNITVILKYKPILFQICIDKYGEVMFLISRVGKRDLCHIRKLWRFTKFTVEILCDVLLGNVKVCRFTALCLFGRIIFCFCHRICNGRWFALNWFRNFYISSGTNRVLFLEIVQNLLLFCGKCCIFR